MTRSLTSSESRPGRPQRIGSYRILDLLGKGAMGTVYRARHLETGKVVALKVPSSRVARDPSLTTILRQEFDLQRRLRHPNIVSALALESAGSVPFMVLEYVDGQSVKELIATRGRFPQRRAIEVLRQVARAMMHYDSKGLVHRDVKPANILIARDGTVKLCDLGIGERAYFLQLEAEAHGTPDYVSPEIIVGSEDVDVRSDLYSLGATFFAMLTGSPPFPREEIAAALEAHLSDPVPSVRTLRPDIDPRTECILGHLLAKDPERRYRFPHRLEEDCESWLRGEALSHRHQDEEIVERSQPRSMVRQLWVGALTLGILVASVSFFATRTRSLEAPEEHEPTETLARRPAPRAEAPPTPEPVVSSREAEPAPETAPAHTPVETPVKVDRSQLVAPLEDETSPDVSEEIGDPDGADLTADAVEIPMELPARRRHREIAVAAARRGDWGRALFPGVGRVSTRGDQARLSYDFKDPQQLLDWETPGSGHSWRWIVEDGELVLQGIAVGGNPAAAWNFKMAHIHLRQTVTHVHELEYRVRVTRDAPFAVGHFVRGTGYGDWNLALHSWLSHDYPALPSQIALGPRGRIDAEDQPPFRLKPRRAPYRISFEDSRHQNTSRPSLSVNGRRVLHARQRVLVGSGKVGFAAVGTELRIDGVRLVVSVDENLRRERLQELSVTEARRLALEESRPFRALGGESRAGDGLAGWNTFGGNWRLERNGMVADVPADVTRDNAYWTDRWYFQAVTYRGWDEVCRAWPRRRVEARISFSTRRGRGGFVLGFLSPKAPFVFVGRVAPGEWVAALVPGRHPESEGGALLDSVLARAKLDGVSSRARWGLTTIEDQATLCVDDREVLTFPIPTTVRGTQRGVGFAQLRGKGSLRIHDVSIAPANSPR